MTQLRGYQKELKAGIYSAWQQGAQCVIGATATGSGKTVTMASMAGEIDGRGVIQAHRAELVGQLSLALAREGVRHNITAAKSTVRAICDAHMEEVGACFYVPGARWNVASVDTLIKRGDPEARKATHVFTDEGHHVLADNKWGKGMLMYPDAKALLMTATPCRADGKGLGRHHDGLADALVIGPGLADLMGQGYLTTYRVAEAQAADLDMSDVHMTAGGDFNMQEAARAVKRSNRIVGDAVATYKELIPSKRAILFAADIEHAQTLADAFNAASVPAAIVTGETEEATRRTVMKRFKAKELLVLINVDLFGEGVDVPAVDAVIMCRPTASFSLYAQQIGRMLRLMISPILMAAWDTFTVAQRMAHIAASEKPHGVLIDHVGNIRREFKIGEHTYRGLPEGFNAWSLDRRQRRRSGGGDGIPVRMCDGCFKPYERIFDSCPYCGKLAPPPAMRGGPEQVDGDVTWLDDETLAKLRGQIAIVDGAPRVPQNVGPAIQVQAIRLHQERQAAQHHLREAIAQWAGWHHLDSNTTNYRRFFHTFGLDVLAAMGLGAGEAAKLTERIKQTYTTP